MNAPRGRLVASRMLLAQFLGSVGYVAWLDTYALPDGTRVRVRTVGARRLGTHGYGHGDHTTRDYRRRVR